MTYKCGYCESTVEADTAPLCEICLERTSRQMKSRMTPQPPTVTQVMIQDGIEKRLHGR